VSFAVPLREITRERDNESNYKSFHTFSLEPIYRPEGRDGGGTCQQVGPYDLFEFPRDWGFLSLGGLAVRGGLAHLRD
jgi:hypothetical protein